MFERAHPGRRLDRPFVPLGPPVKYIPSVKRWKDKRGRWTWNKGASQAEVDEKQRRFAERYARRHGSLSAPRESGPVPKMTVPPEDAPRRKLTAREQLAEDVAAGRVSASALLAALGRPKRPARPETLPQQATGPMDPEHAKRFVLALLMGADIVELGNDPERLHAYLRRQNTGMLADAAATLTVPGYSFLRRGEDDLSHERVVADIMAHVAGPPEPRTVPELRAALKAAGQPATGTKPVLQAQWEAVKAAAGVKTVAPATAASARKTPAKKGTKGGPKVPAAAVQRLGQLVKFKDESLIRPYLESRDMEPMLAHLATLLGVKLPRRKPVPMPNPKDDPTGVKREAARLRALQPIIDAILPALLDLRRTTRGGSRG